MTMETPPPAPPRSVLGWSTVHLTMAAASAAAVSTSPGRKNHSRMSVLICSSVSGSVDTREATGVARRMTKGPVHWALMAAMSLAKVASLLTLIRSGTLGEFVGRSTPGRIATAARVWCIPQ